MKWQDMRRSKNIEDRRNQSGGRGGLTMGVGGGGLGGILQLLFFLPGKAKWIVLLIVGFLFLGSGSLLGGGGNILPDTGIQNQRQIDVGNDTVNSSADEGYQYMSAILGNTEDFWSTAFAEQGRQYHPPKLVLYTNTTSTACGFGSAQAGPFYCPGDQTLYIDLNFMDELRTKYQAPGDFPMAYVIAHEVGHHIQQELGIMDEYTRVRQTLDETQANQLNVRLELQADYFAGSWAKYANASGLLEAGDKEEALQAAWAVGDDTIQKSAYGTVVPDSFTHGSAQQRQAWFNYGFQYGDFEHMDTFNNRLSDEGTY